MTEPREPAVAASTRRRLILLARVVIGLVLLALILRRVNFSEPTIASGRQFFLGMLGALTFLPLAQCAAALRWRTLLGQGAPGWGYLTRLYFVSLFFSLFLPTSVGGDAVRMVAAARNMRQSGEAVASVVLDRVLGVFALGAYLLVGLWSVPQVLAAANARLSVDLHRFQIVVAVVVLIAGLVTVIWSARRFAIVGRFVDQGISIFRRLRAEPLIALRAAALAMLVQALYILAWAMLASAMGLGLPFSVFLIAVPLVSLGAMLPITVSGLGVREGMWLLLLRPYALPEANIVTFSLMYFVCVALVGAVGGLLFVLRGTDLDTVHAGA